MALSTCAPGHRSGRTSYIFSKARIIARLNGRLKQPIVQKIRASVTAPPGTPKSKAQARLGRPDFPRRAAKRQARPPVPTDDAAANRGRELAAEIEDEEVRDMMARLIASVMRANNERPALPEGQITPIAPIGTSRG